MKRKDTREERGERIEDIGIRGQGRREKRGQRRGGGQETGERSGGQRQEERRGGQVEEETDERRRKERGEEQGERSKQTG